MPPYASVTAPEDLYFSARAQVGEPLRDTRPASRRPLKPTRTHSHAHGPTWSGAPRAPMTALAAERAWKRQIAAALGGRVPPALAEAVTEPTVRELQGQIEHYRRVLALVKACLDHLCAPCATIAGRVVARADHRPRRDMRVRATGARR